RVSRGTTRFLGDMKRRFPTTALELDDALATPKAPARWQPTPEAIAAVPTVPAPYSPGIFVVLRPRVPVLQVLLGSLFWFAVLTACIALYILAPWSGGCINIHA